MNAQPTLFPEPGCARCAELERQNAELERQIGHLRAVIESGKNAVARRPESKKLLPPWGDWDAVQRWANKDCRKVVELFRAHGPGWQTGADAVHAELGMTPGSARARFSDLYNVGALVRASSRRTGKTIYGNAQFEYRLNEDYLAAVS